MLTQNATGRTLSLRQASPKSSALHLEHACTRCAPDVISQNSCSLKTSFRAFNASSLHLKRTNRRWGIICIRQGQWWCSGVIFGGQPYQVGAKPYCPVPLSWTCMHSTRAWRHRLEITSLEELIQRFKCIQFARQMDQ